MIVEDTTLLGFGDQGIIDPFDPAMVQPSSIDLRLGTSFRVMRTHRIGLIDLADIPPADDLSEAIVIPDDGAFIIHPGEFVLGATLEYLRVPTDMAMCLDGKSSLARLGLMVHITAGFFDPGFKGIGTIEMANLSPVPIVLRPGYPICQSRWMLMQNPPNKPYDGRYQGDLGATGSRYGKEAR